MDLNSILDRASRTATDWTVENRLCSPIPCTAITMSVKSNLGAPRAVRGKLSFAHSVLFISIDLAQGCNMAPSRQALHIPD